MIVSLAVVKGLDRLARLKFLFRIYDIQSVGKLEKTKVEKLLQLAYDNPSIFKNAEYKKQLDNLFATDKDITMKEFEQFTGDLDLIGGWVESVVSCLTNPPSPQLCQLEQKYSAAMEQSEIMKRFNISEGVTTQLRQTFNVKCGHQPRPEMTLPIWMEITKAYLTMPLACAIFCSKVNTLKPVWRFAEFAEFCVTFAGPSIEAKAYYLVQVFLVESQKVLKNAAEKAASNKNVITSKVPKFDANKTKSAVPVLSAPSLIDPISSPGMLKLISYSYFYLERLTLIS